MIVINGVDPSRILLGETDASAVYKGDQLVWSGFPSGYTRCEWLQSEGDSWIITGYTYAVGDEQMLTFSVPHLNVDTAFYGVYTSGPCEVGSLPGYIRLNVSERIKFDSISLDTVFKAHMQPDDKKWHLNGRTPAEGQIETRSQPAPSVMFGRAYFGTVDKHGACRIYGFWAKRGGRLVANYIPALDQNGTPCMYDTVTRQSYYNAGTGEFTWATLQ